MYNIIGMSDKFMNIDDVSKVVNKNLKLYRKSFIGHLAIVSAVSTSAIVLTNFAIDTMSTITSMTTKFMLIIGIEMVDTAFITSTLFKTKPKYNKLKIKKLKKLKEELDNGINRFETVKRSELSSEIIKYMTKHKVK